MYSGSVLSGSDAVAAVELFGQGFTLLSLRRSCLTLPATLSKCCASGGSYEERVHSYERTQASTTSRPRLRSCVAASRVSRGGLSPRNTLCRRRRRWRIGRSFIAARVRTACARSGVVSCVPPSGVARGGTAGR
jgi:hypothetical protein